MGEDQLNLERYGYRVQTAYKAIMEALDSDTSLSGLDQRRAILRALDEMDDQAEADLY